MKCSTCETLRLENAALKLSLKEDLFIALEDRADFLEEALEMLVAATDFGHTPKQAIRVAIGSFVINYLGITLDEEVAGDS